MCAFLAQVARLLEFETIRIANSAEQALEMNLSGIDVMLLDWSLGEMDGLKFAQCVRRGDTSANATIPIVVITAHPLTALDASRDPEIDGFLIKPVSRWQIHRTIQAALDARGQNRAATGGVSPESGS